MPRKARKKSCSGINYIRVRGINRQDLFEDDEDRQRFNESLELYKENLSLEYIWLLNQRTCPWDSSIV